MLNELSGGSQPQLYIRITKGALKVLTSGCALQTN